MPETHRKSKARAAADLYAPKPEGSSLTYGLIAVVLVGLAMISFAMFYDANILAYPVVIMVGLAAALIGGVILRKRRKRNHAAAFAAEFERQDNSPPS